WDIDLEAARSRGVIVCKYPIHGCVMVAEHMLMQMLALLKKVREQMSVVQAAPSLSADWIGSRQCDEDWFAYNWSGRSGIGTLANATVGILGFGEIGVELAQRLVGFDCRVLYHKRTRLPSWVENERGLTYAQPDEIAAQADIIASLLPWQGPNFPIDAAYVQRMKQGALLVHAGSGGIVDETSVLNALQSGHLAGAAFDTYNWEPMRPDDPLLAGAADPAINLVRTPHTAAGGFSAGGSGRSRDYDNILALLNGRPLRYQIV
ncbi:MAG: NAD(P)-dependent oxidoreductase, partial [Caldilineaceae bacterium]